jgi:uncharacterized protein YqgQ
MKKLVFLLAGLMVASVINSQTVEEIVKKYTVANKLDQVSKLKTIKLTAKMSAMGMEMPMEMWMKNPNKIKTVTSMNGMQMVQAFDGVKGYQINPMQGTTPVEMTSDEIKQILRSNLFQNYMEDFLKKGQLVLDGEEKVNEKPAYKLKAKTNEGVAMDMFIDKSSFLLIKTSITTQGMTIDSYPSDYTDTKGFMVPMKITTSATGMEFSIIFTNVEVDIPMEDSIFTIN